VARTLRFPSVLLQPLGHLSALESTTCERPKGIIAHAGALRAPSRITFGFSKFDGRETRRAAVLWPERCLGIVSVSGYLIGSQASGKTPLPPAAELEWWYQYYFATERGREGYDKYRHDFAKLIWQLASPKWKFDDATFNRSARRSTTPITLLWSCTTTAGGWGWPKAKRSTTRSKSAWLPDQ
jgi:hypothetical protein